MVRDVECGRVGIPREKFGRGPRTGFPPRYPNRLIGRPAHNDVFRSTDLAVAPAGGGRSRQVKSLVHGPAVEADLCSTICASCRKSAARQTGLVIRAALAAGCRLSIDPRN